eukprot:9480421-Pyramimonas_sp.AAC.1
MVFGLGVLSSGPETVKQRLNLKNQPRGNGPDFQGLLIEKTGRRMSGEAVRSSVGRTGASERRSVR